MKRRRANPNRTVMIGIMLMAVVVLAVVVDFWMWCFPNGVPHSSSVPATKYDILLSEGLRGDSVQLQINDSVVFSGSVVSDTQMVSVAMPEKENLLMVMRPGSGEVSSFQLPSKGGRIVLREHNGQLEMDEQ
ncbi:MAG: hypothetical protein LUC45_02095 [Paraprevotella sp.]|nr:hypothetical protein [Paraprevotella sp.]